jgi:taurine dioxygenase
MSTVAGLKKQDITRHVGTEIEGLDLQTMSDAAVEELLEVIARRGVVVVRNQEMTIPEQIAFGARLGELHVHPAYAQSQWPEALHIYGDENSKMVPGEGWHSDVSCEERPPAVSMLRIETTPSVGGDTAFSHQGALLRSFSDTMQSFFRSLKARHSGDLPWRGGYKSVDPKMYPRNLHPMVRTHPITGEDALYVNSGFTDRIWDMEEFESDALLKMIFDRIAFGVEFQCRVRWEPNTVTFWDNRVVQHHACWDYFPEKREGWRVTTTGERPYLAGA